MGNYTIDSIKLVAFVILLILLGVKNLFLSLVKNMFCPIRLFWQKNIWQKCAWNQIFLFACQMSNRKIVLL